MDNLTNKPMYTDDLFPQGITQEFHGFMYTINSSRIKIQKGDLVLAAVHMFKETLTDTEKGLSLQQDETQLVYLVCICEDKDEDVLTLRSNGLVFTCGEVFCRRLTFVIPVFPEQGPYNLETLSVYN